ncbi:hypothetical protein ISF_08487 [Cordyceps fumosorosea ARSEF 2679]|uniref:2EXR domain-containing protein n=1 Tax=Cordyceps fumosorosea (strain ARSEF 2679) TaxID=1081104 RepID=A0A167M6S1_CORFA|nr:hypothetical protein ISF_08487 [Cordyceps fumosorosea ARSEF 2679]OAA54007.1 hypothetical protein ISF_08487 [Cordyceps fumosorosea ARSEF 2679]
MSGIFERLPMEMRQLIWTMALGEHGDIPTMVPYRTSRPYMLEEEESDYEDYANYGEDYLMTDTGDVPPDHGDEATVNSGVPVAERVAPTATLPSSSVTRRDVDDDNDRDDRQDQDSDDDLDRYDVDGEGDDDSLDTDVGDFEPGNPYAQERAWDDDVLIPVYLPPLLLVNREARAITLDWLAKHNVQLTRTKIAKGEIDAGFPPTPEGELPPYVRRYDPARDHLWVDRYCWRRFCDRLHMSHVLGGVLTEEELEPEQLEQLEPPHDIGAEIRNLALPAFTVYQSTEAVADAVRFMPAIESLACIWGDLPTHDWRPDLIYETVKDEEGRDRTKVRQLLMPRWDHVPFSETVSEEEMERRRRDTERIRAEVAAARGKGKEVKKPDGDDDDEDEDDEDDEDDDMEDDEEEEEARGPLVTMCSADPDNRHLLFHERGYLGNWMQEVYDVLALMELPDHVRDDYDGSFTLPIVPCKAVCPGGKATGWQSLGRR